MARRKSQTNNKRRRDPNAPKKAQNAWRIFVSQNREEVQNSNSNLSYREVIKKLGEMWRQSDDNTKRRYQKEYQTSQSEYSEKMAAYKEEQKNKRQQSSGGAQSKKNTNGQTKKGNNNEQTKKGNDDNEQTKKGNSDEQNNQSDNDSDNM